MMKQQDDDDHKEIDKDDKDDDEFDIDQIRPEKILFAETQNPMNKILEVDNMSLQELRRHLKARGLNNVSGCQSDLVVMLKDVLKQEQIKGFNDRANALGAEEKKLKALVALVQEEMEDFDLSQVHGWKKDLEKKGKWDWTKNRKSLAHRDKLLQAEYDVQKESEKKFIPKRDPPRKTAARHRKSSVVQQVVDTKTDALECMTNKNKCTYQGRVDHQVYHCVNKKITCSDGTVLSTCGFHTITCVLLDQHSPDEITGEMKNNAIKVPNALGLCSVCWHRVHGGTTPLPVLLPKHQCPGTHLLDRKHDVRVEQLKQSIDSVYEAPKESTLLNAPKAAPTVRFCKWRFNFEDSGIQMRCTNEVVREGSTVCGYHTRVCEMPHPDANPKIEVPNRYGLCNNHFVARAGVSAAGAQLEENWNYLLKNEVAYPPGVEIYEEEEEPGRKHALRPRDLEGSGDKKLKKGFIANIDDMHDSKVAIALTNSDVESHTSIVSTKDDEVKKTADNTAPADANAHTMKSKPNVKEKKSKFGFGKKKDSKKKPQKTSFVEQATTIQRVYRGFRGRIYAQETLRKKLVVDRHESSIVIQAMFRAFIGRKAARKHVEERVRLANCIHKIFRGHQAREEYLRIRSAIIIQKHVRGYLSTLEMLCRKQLKQYMYKKSDEAWARITIARSIHGYVRRFRHRKLQERIALENAMSVKIQRMWRRQKVLSIFRALVYVMIRRAKHARIIQRVYHKYTAKQHAYLLFLKRMQAAIVIQAYWRMFRAKMCALLEKESLMKAWHWLGVDQKSHDHDFVDFVNTRPLISRSATFSWQDKGAQRLKDLMNGVRRGYEEDETKTSTTDTETAIVEKKRSATEKMEDEERAQEIRDREIAFLRYDPAGTGVMKTSEFEKTLKSLGYGLTSDEAQAITRRWANSMGYVHYIAFLDYVSTEVYACAMHRAWACPKCISYGPCVKCKCRCFSKSGDFETHRTICSCGHYIAMHTLIPSSLKVHKRKNQQNGLAENELKRSLMLPPFIPTEPSSVTGTRIERTDLQMTYSSNDLGFDGPNQTPMRVVHAEDQTKLSNTLAFQNLSEDIIHQISEHSTKVAKELVEANQNTLRPNTHQGLPRPSTTRHASGRPRTQQKGSGRPVTQQRSGRPNTSKRDKSPSRPSTSTIPSNEDTIEALAEESEKVPQVDANKIGSMLLSSAARPQSALYYSSTRTRPLTVDSGAYARRLVAADLQGRELRATAANNSKRSWTTTQKSQKSFNLKDPIPLIIHDNLRMETNISPLYVDVLLALASDECGLLEDWNAFVAFVFQSFTFMERFWKRLCYDLRTGTLDRHLKLPDDTRMMVEEFLKPNPTRAAMLDTSMKQLGFYQSKAEQGSKIDHTTTKSLVPLLPPVRAPSAAPFTSARASAPVPEDSEPMAKTVEDFSDRHIAKVKDEISHEDVYKMATKPKLGPVSIVKRDTRSVRKFVCTFPGCSLVFGSASKAAEHSRRAHEGKMKLANARTENDEHMHGYWPKDTPWAPTTHTKSPTRKKGAFHNPNTALEKQLLKQSGITNSHPYLCDRFGCKERFESLKALRAHIQSTHLRLEEMAALIGSYRDPKTFLKFRGPIASSPPSPLPKGLKVPCCSTHWVVFQPRCEECAALVSSQTPLPPLEFFDTVKIHNELSFSISKPGAIHVRVSNTVEVLGKVWSVFRDKLGRGYVAYARYIMADELSDLPVTYDREFQLVQETGNIIITSVENIVGMSYVLTCGRKEFHKRRNTYDIPRLPGKLAHFQPKRPPGNYFVDIDDNEAETENGAFVPYRLRIRGTY